MFFLSHAPTVSDILEDYRKDFLLRRCRAVRSLGSEIKRLNEHIGHIRVSKITTKFIREYQAARTLEGAKAATVNKELADLRAAFTLALSNEVISAIPRFPPKLPNAKPRQGFFEFDQYRAIRLQLPSWAADVLDFGYYSGWRWGEVTGLTWGEVDLTGLHVRLDPDRSKNKESRTIPLMGLGLSVLGRRAKVRADGIPYVFHRSGYRITSATWFKHWKRATKRAGHPDRLFHDLRRSVVRSLEHAGVSRKVAMGWVGHQTEAMYRRYHIVTERDVDEAGRKLTELMDSQDTGRGIVMAFPQTGEKKG